MRARCLKCRMGFRLEGPTQRMIPEWMRCPLCLTRFWTNSPNSRYGTAIVGVLPEDMTDNLVTEDVA